MATLTSQNPYTGEINKTFETLTDQELNTAIQKSHEAYQSWKSTSLEKRKELFLKLADLIDERRSDYAQLETQEMGSLHSFSQAVLKGTANLVRRNIQHVDQVIGAKPFDHDGLEGHIQHDPLGVIYGIAPWNFPFNQLLRAAVPNILVGNTQVYKHASNVPMCLAAIEQLFLDAGFPNYVFTALFITSSQSEQILAHPAVHGVNLTGSEPAGAAVGALAGKYLKRSILELGGNDAFVLLDHQDTDAMVKQATACRISNGGQRCNSSKRFIVLEEHYDAFVRAFGEYMGSLKVGDPMDEATQVPPMSSARLVDEIHRQVTQTIEQGATLVTGGYIIDKKSNLYAPTVLADVTPHMTSAREEVFGPVATVIKSTSVQESVRLANDSDFGLSAVVFGDDTQECKKVAAQLDGGMIFVNQPAGSKASLPFGGIKKSGYGKENGPDGLLAFTNKKAVVY